MENFRYRLPSASALIAFECTWRHGNFSRAADELGTSQPAVSRHIAALEAFVGVRLLERGRGRAILTPEGQRLHHAVLRGYEEIATAVRDIRTPRRAISIACTYSISHLWLMPRYEQLQRALGDDVEVITRSSEYEYHDRLRSEGIDICLTYAGDSIKGVERRLLLGEEVVPLCSPSFAKAHRPAFTALGVAALAQLPLLNLGQPNYGWATWETWFGHHGLPHPELSAQRQFGNYVFLLEAASDGAGVALGWRGLSDDYIAQDRLHPLPVPIEPLSSAGGLYLLVNHASRFPDLVEKAAISLGADTPTG